MLIAGFSSFGEAYMWFPMCKYIVWDFETLGFKEKNVVKVFVDVVNELTINSFH